jgi:hypothetical protein
MREATLNPGMKMTLTFPSSVSLATLWPTHTDYFDETVAPWIVPHKHGRIAMSPKSTAGDTTTYALVTDSLQ